MKKKLNIFGRKVPLFAILIALMVIGTASAAVFLNYATLSGDVKVDHGISVTEDGGSTPIAIDGIGNLVFDDTATFTVMNNNEEPVLVDLVTTLYLDGGEIVASEENYLGLTVDYSVIDGTGIESGTVLVPPGGLTIDVDFEYAVNALEGTYTIQVNVNPYLGDKTYETFTGENAMETLELSYKDGDYNPLEIGKVQVDFAPMGNEFYYEMAFEGVELTDYAFIYYADKPNRFVNWGGDNPGAVIQILPTPITDGDMITGCINLDMDMPHPNDANYDTNEYCIEFDQCDGGAKLWVVPTNQLTDGTSLPMIEWNRVPLLLETDLIHYIDTDKS